MQLVTARLHGPPRVSRAGLPAILQSAPSLMLTRRAHVFDEPLSTVDNERCAIGLPPVSQRHVFTLLFRDNLHSSKNQLLFSRLQGRSSLVV